jgi:glycopeptide antibiotics resistance protein
LSLNKILFLNKNYFKKALLIGIILSFCIELSQYIINLLLGVSYKVTDVDDILLNTLGFIVGYILYKIFQSIIIKLPIKTNINK